MSEQAGKTVIDVVSEGRYAALFAVRNLFGVTRLSDINEAWVPVISAMQEMPEQLIKEVAIPIIEKFFEEEALDVKRESDRVEAQRFAPLITKSIDTAAQYVFANIQQQNAQKQTTRSRLLTGRL